MPKQMIVVGLIGLFVNALVGYILSKGQSNLNMRSAVLHVFADMITSLSAVIVALAIMFFDFVWLDPIGSIVTSAIIISGGIKITKESFNILMEGTPDGYSIDDITNCVQKLGNKNISVEDVKLWCVNEEEVFTLIRISDASKIYGEEAVLPATLKKEIHNATHIKLENIYVDITQSHFVR